MLTNKRFIYENKVFNFIELCNKLNLNYKFNDLYEFYVNNSNIGIKLEDIDKIYSILDIVRHLPNKVYNYKRYMEDFSVDECELLDTYISNFINSYNSEEVYINNKSINNQLNCIKVYRRMYETMK